ncbi:hypothetical protein L3Q82_016679 [Scortum barcoo]|uniref:Uncharacterized protein n=1 Tax=Scortum barcoo TaxID=214431 RepID=A0ACB8X8U9_9TELE|nr:hypothetical protein L3Q82_016679 [Scortum barcoo]
MDSRIPLQLLQVTHREDPDWLHHRLVQARVISPESGHMKSDSSFSEDVFVKLDSSCKMFILRLWDLNTFMELKQG